MAVPGMQEYLYVNFNTNVSCVLTIVGFYFIVSDLEIINLHKNQKLLRQTTYQQHLLNGYGNNISLRCDLQDNEILSPTLLPNIKNKCGLTTSWLICNIR